MCHFFNTGRKFVALAVMRTFAVCAMSLFLAGFAATAKAQTMTPAQTASYWKQIQKADRHIQAVKALWQQLKTEPADPDFSPEFVERTVQEAVAEAKASGLPPERVKEREEGALWRAERISGGYKQRSELMLVRVGTKTHADAVIQPVESLAVPTPKERVKNKLLWFVDAP